MKPVFLTAAVAMAALLAAAPPADAAHKRVAHPAQRSRAPAKAAPAAVPAGPSFPNFQNAPSVASACTVGLEGAQQRARALEKRRPGLEWLKAWDELYTWEEDQSNALTFLKNVHPNADIRAAAETCELRWQDFQSTLSLNEAIYRGGRQSQPLLKDPIDRRAVEVALQGFEDSGVALPADRRAHAKELSDRIVALGQQFQKNIRDDHAHVAFTEAELKGVPDGVWKDAPRDPDGRIELGIDDPSFYPVMQYAEDAGARERMWRAKTNQGGPENLKVLAQITKARLDYAKLLGFPSYADYLLRRRMAESPARVEKFLDDVHAAVADEEKRDIAELRDAKARQLGQPVDAVKVQRWDPMFYSERLRREKYAVDDEAFRPYFPPQESLRFVMRIAEKLFNVRYDRIEGTWWAPDVQAYAVTDLATNRKIASLWVDLYPRDGKYGGSSVWTLRTPATSANRPGQAVLVANFDRRGLTLQELEILLHEFGHSLHVDLSATRWASDGGLNVMEDFLEAPSQMLESWVYDKKVLKVFRDVCPACKPVPDELVDKARAARDFGKGLKFARQHLFAAYDLALHGPAAVDPMETWQKMEGATPLGYVPGTTFPAGFAHIAGRYGAGYYSYLWSLVVAMDMRTAFAADKLDPKVGARYRADVLSQGGQKPPLQLVHDFLGRDMSTQAFYDYLKK
ncbi:MAG: M3 family metallopeptidase [Burkholderiaceae bacterium]